MNRILTIFTLSILLLAADWSDAAPGPRKRTRPKDGEYPLMIGGMVSGTGTGSVTGNMLTLTGEVTTEGGTKGTLSVTVPLKNNHFDGPGTVMGQTATFTGRLDQPDDVTEKTINGVRLTCTFKTVSREYGRIIGNLPFNAASSQPTTRSGGRDRDKDKDKRNTEGGEREDRAR